MAAEEWSLLDRFGLVERSFRGDREALVAHLRATAGHEPALRIHPPTVETVFVSRPPRTERCVVIRVTAPWGDWTWVPADVARPRTELRSITRSRSDV